MNHNNVKLSIILGIGLLSFLGFLVLHASLVQAAPPADLPIRPTPTATPYPTPTITPDPTSHTEPRPRQYTGGFIRLNVPKGTSSMWTKIQWQDDVGNWHDVEGWQGTLDKSASGGGQKTWWVPDSLFKHGAFRWVIYDKQGGEVLGISQAFNTPKFSDVWVMVEVPLSASPKDSSESYRKNAADIPPND